MVITRFCVRIEGEEPINFSVRDGGRLHWSNLPEPYKVLSIDVVSYPEDNTNGKCS